MQRLDGWYALTRDAAQVGELRVVAYLECLEMRETELQELKRGHGLTFSDIGPGHSPDSALQAS